VSAKNLDPLSVNNRLYKQIARLLDQLEAKDSEITIPQRINALIAVGRVQIMFSNLRKAESRERDDAGAGSEVRKFEAAFARTNASRRRARSGGTDEDSLIADDDPDASGGSPEDDNTAA
jgi:hypothetical protein